MTVWDAGVAVACCKICVTCVLFDGTPPRPARALFSGRPWARAWAAGWDTSGRPKPSARRPPAPCRRRSWAPPPSRRARDRCPPARTRCDRTATRPPTRSRPRRCSPARPRNTEIRQAHCTFCNDRNLVEQHYFWIDRPSRLLAEIPLPAQLRGSPFCECRCRRRY